MKVVLDTNIFINAVFAKSSASSKIIQLIDQNQLQLLVSDVILTEYDYQLNLPYLKGKGKRVNKKISSILKKAEKVEPRQKIKIIKLDPADNRFLEAAVEGKVDFIISSDNHLLKLGSYRGIKIARPSEFVKNISRIMTGFEV